MQIRSAFSQHSTINTVSEIKKNILATLAYFDAFNYPLTREEVCLFLPAKYELQTFDEAMACLISCRLIFRFDKFYTLKNDPYLVQRRTKGNQKAAEMIQTARKVGNWLIKFPYVRGVAISGSLSKNYADDRSDIDLFIITAPNRLWIARTLMHCFKKLTFLVNKQHCFCMNYYVDEQGLEIAEKNIYTATEVVTLIPIQGDTTFADFFTANAWTRKYLPNHIMRMSTAKSLEINILKNFIELLLNNKLGDFLDGVFMKITARRWKQKTQLKKLNDHGVLLAMTTGKHFAKPDPRNFQSNLIGRFEAKVAALLIESEHSVAN
ncbi:nucleotidyltransferase domain-containing protein [Mucilaginibacter sp. FT3.2]|uniref:nucleotidyltransferase domain-containing protein n=1 Tax=Mucilaginibacter sp. FT3.2 TaxID=2723090 RepID=UPI00161112B6|nr:nucleotidyltransferase domain-containing protein [Mucilaginibacter sp. FT3.2]MBB6233559.1 putative nucleotidyltransferase/fluoride ion exporter CrcB/FEX [Mucilaginibacter sp. FT3.2]